MRALSLQRPVRRRPANYSMMSRFKEWPRIGRAADCALAGADGRAPERLAPELRQ